MGRWLSDNVFASQSWDSVTLVDTVEASAGLVEAVSRYPAGVASAAVTEGGADGIPLSEVRDLTSGATTDLGREYAVVCFAVPPRILPALAARIVPALAATSQVLVSAQGMQAPLEALAAVAGERPVIGMHALFDVGSRQLEGQAVYVVPAGDPHPNAHRWLVELVRGLGGTVKFGTAAKHDASMTVVQALAHQALLGFAGAVVSSGLDLHDDVWAARTPLFETLFGLAVRVLDEAQQPTVAAIQTVLDGPGASAALQQAAEAVAGDVAAGAAVGDPAVVEARIAAIRERFSGALFDTVRGTAAAAVVAAQSKRLQLAHHQRTGQLVGIRPLGRADAIRVGRIVEVDPVEVTIDEVLVGRRGRAALLDGPGAQNAARLGLGGKVRRTVFSLGHVDLVVGDDLDRELSSWLAYLRRDVRFLVPESVAGSGVAEVVAPVPGIGHSELVSEVVRTGQRSVVVRVEVRVDRDVDDMVEQLRRRVGDAFRWPRGLSLPLVTPTDRVTYLGPAGTFSEVAAAHLATDLGMPSARLVPVDSFDQVLGSVAAGGVAVLPITSSSSGLVSRSADALLRYAGDLTAGGVIDVAVRIDAYIREDLRLDELHGAPVYSHPQALAQCSAFIRRWGLVPSPCASTADALRTVSESVRPAVALAGEGRGEGLHLKVAEREVDDLSGSVTRFLILGLPGCFGDLVGGSAPTLRSIYLAESLTHVAEVMGSAVGEPGFDEVLSDAAGRALWVTSRTVVGSPGGAAARHTAEVGAVDGAAGRHTSGVDTTGGAAGRHTSGFGAAAMRSLGRAPWSPRTPVVRVEI